MLNKMPVNPSKLAESLNELLVDYCEFQILVDSPKDYFGLPVKVIYWDKAYYDGSQGKGLLTFKIGDEVFSCLIQYDSWGHCDPKDLANSLDTDCSIYPDTLRSAVANADPKIFAEQMAIWKEEHKKACEEDMKFDGFFTKWEE